MTPALGVTITGDLALGGEYLQRARPGNLPLTYPFSPLQASLANTELLVVNLEGPIGTSGVPRSNRSALLHNDPEVLDWLASFPASVCVLANNHMMDYGAEALNRTLELLRTRGIHAVGAGLTQNEADNALKLNINGLKIGVLAFTTDEAHVGSVLAGSDSPGSTGLPIEIEACKRVSTLAQDTDVVVVILHWGYEYFNYPPPAQVTFARKLVDSGATLVAGHHPHVQQGFETIGNSYICHSLGNLLLPEMRSQTGRVQYRKPATKQFALLHAQLEPKRVLNPRLQGGRCNTRYNLEPYSGPAQQKFEKEMAALAQPLSSHDYALFWQRYEARRIKELKREGLRDAIAKIASSDWRTLVRTVSLNDFKRNFQRVFGSL